MVRKVNKSLKDWVNFVKHVQKEEGLGYKDAMMRAKVRKNKGEKWMSGGNNTPPQQHPPGTPKDLPLPPVAHTAAKVGAGPAPAPASASSAPMQHAAKMGPIKGGSRKRKTSKKQKGGRRKTCSKK
uniref:Uncharacterized protein n=1 Tax=viral metagenome TaxID=1070528 RepID=A0A6C0HHR0_9ZZZZ